MVEMRTLVPLLLLVVGLGACSAGENIEAVEQEVAGFHRLYNEERFEDIHGAASDAFIRSTSARDFDRMMRGVRQRLGPVQSANRTGFSINYNNGTGTMMLSYATEFGSGQGTEEFTYVIGEERPQLLHYNIRSDALLAPLPAAAEEQE
jgi:hypothetical protein